MNLDQMKDLFTLNCVLKPTITYILQKTHPHSTTAIFRHVRRK